MAAGPFAEGMLAGYGIAIPLGAIAVLIVDTALRRGFRPGVMAGGGAASADLAYAGLAALGGPAAAAVLEPLSFWLRLVSGLFLVGIGVYGVARGLRSARQESGNPSVPRPPGWGNTYFQFLGLTLLNPLTVAYFGALILSQPFSLEGPGAKFSFVAGVGIASLSWQTLLAAAGSLGRRRVTTRARVAATILGNSLVVGLGARALWRLLV